MKTFIIAEAGVNHNGDVELARRMVREAAAAGADAVKFQTFRAEDIVTRDAPKAEYQKVNDSAASQYEMLRNLELTDTEFESVAEECRRAGVEFMSTPFSIEAARLLKRLGMKTWKLPSGEITNLPLIEYVCSVAETIIMSTGMATIEEIGQTVDLIRSSGFNLSNLYLLHCTTAYPTPYSDVNLKAMDALRVFETGGVGYSDHTEGIVVSVAAVARGACIIEKHFTLDPSLPGPDQKTSLTPDLFAAMVCEIRNVETILGSGEKEVTDSERANIAVARKSIVASAEIRPGDVFADFNLTAKRPGTGLSPMLWCQLIGKKSTKHYFPDMQIDKNELK